MQTFAFRAYNIHMQSAFEILSVRPQVKKERSKRDMIIREIYQVYTSENQKKLLKKSNWIKYIAHLKENRIKHNAVTMWEFKKSKKYIKEYPISTIAIFLARNKEDRLYEILSIAKDMDNRGINAAAFILSNRFI